MGRLHTIDVLLALSEEEGAAGDWAQARLALEAPDRVTRFPGLSALPDVPLAAGWPAMHAHLITALRRERDPMLAMAASTLALMGQAPLAAADFGEDLRALLQSDGSDVDMWLALALALLGQARLPDLRAVDRGESALRELVLPVVALRVGESLLQVEALVPEVATAIKRRSDESPGLLSAVLNHLGVPVAAAPFPSAREAAAAGALAAGGTPREITIQGGKLRQSQGWVRGLLEGVSGAGAALLREAFREDPHPSWGYEMIAAAGWLSAYTEGDPMSDVVSRFAGVRPDRLAAARRAWRTEDREAVTEALRLRADPAIALVALSGVRGDAELAQVLVEATVGRRALDIRSLAAASVAAWHHPDLVPALLRDAHTRPLALMVAEWAPTEEVTEALLELPTPQNPDSRAQFARTLAAMGDPTTIPRLRGLFADDHDGVLGGERDLVRGLLGVEV